MFVELFRDDHTKDYVKSIRSLQKSILQNSHHQNFKLKLAAFQCANNILLQVNILLLGGSQIKIKWAGYHP
jgi:hypothetical protein